MVMLSVLTPEQIEYVLAQRGTKSAGDLSKELGVSRGCITGHWGRRKTEGDKLQTGRHPGLGLDERNAEIFRRYCDDLQGSTQIAREMNWSVSLVENVLKRMRKAAGMKARGKPPAKPKTKIRRAPKEKRETGEDGKPLPYAPPHAPAYGPPVTFDDLDDVTMSDKATCMCRHYVGNPTDSLFCGRPSEPGRPYCENHVMLAYRSDRAPPRTKDTADKIKKTARDFLEWRRRQVTEMAEAA